MAIVAFSIDAMLPAIGSIELELSATEVAHAHRIVPLFVLGLGCGTLVTGPLSDAFGRRPVILMGSLVFCVGTFLAYFSLSIETLLIARVIQGVGASAARVVVVAIIRDCFSGPAMARMTSFVIMIFTLVPALAPSVGAFILWFFGWREIFIALAVFSVAISTWFFLRQPETLASEDRTPFNRRRIFQAAQKVFSHPIVVRTMLVQAFCYAMLFTVLSVTQPIFEKVLGAGDTFHLWFGAIALVAIIGPLLNAKFVVTYGIVRVVSVVLSVQVAASTLYLLLLFLKPEATTSLPVFFMWQVVTFSMAGMTLGNLNALALEPLGAIAGTASSVITAFGSISASLMAIPAAGLFVDSQLPTIWVILGFAVLARAILASRVFSKAA